MKNNFLILVLLFTFSTRIFALDELILNSDPSFIPTFQSKFSFMLGLNPSLQKSAELSNLVFAYDRKIDDFWLDASFLITNGAFNKMTTNNPDATGLTNGETIDTKSTLTTFGVGIGRDFHYVKALLPYKGIYEFIAADLTYNIYKERASDKSFTGPGMMAKYSLFKKFSDYFSAGAALTYNLAVVKRSTEKSTENSSQQSLTMSFATIGFDLSFFL